MTYKVKRKLREQKELEAIRNIKGCYGTKEYSDKAGICNSCKLNKDCGKVENKPKSKTSIIPVRYIGDEVIKRRKK
jgi:hypothetical protein